MRISNNIKASLEEYYNPPKLKLLDEIVSFFKSGGNLKIKCKKGSGIHIKKKNKGKFTASAKKAGQSVQEHARSVLNNPNATPLQKKRANFARNAAKWKHAKGGSMRIPGVIDSNPNLDNMKGDYVTPKKKKKKLKKKHQDGGIIKAEGGIKIPKNRKVIETIKINNGKLTLEEDSNGKRYWFRNGKLITEHQLKTYKYYDTELGGYRQLRTYYYRNLPYTPNLDELGRRSKEIHDSKQNWRETEFKPSKESITLNIPGSAVHLTTIPINVLDSIAINSGRSNSKIKTGLGLVGKESTFGGASIPLGRDIYQEYDLHALTNNHAYYDDPYNEYIIALAEKYDPKENFDDYGFDKFYQHQLNMDKAQLIKDKEAKYALEHPSVIFNSGATKQFHSNVMADAFARYEDNPQNYNSGQKNYVQMVTDIGNKVFNEKQIQDWWNTSGKKFYEKGLKEK